MAYLDETGVRHLINKLTSSPRYAVATPNMGSGNKEEIPTYVSGSLYCDKFLKLEGGGLRFLNGISRSRKLVAISYGPT